MSTRLLVEGVQAAGHEVVGLASGWRRLRWDARELPVPARSSWLPRILNPVFLDVLGWPTVETVLGPVDVFVATNYAIRPARRARTVALIHDVGRLLHPHLYRRRQVLRARFMVRRCARFADILVVPTESVGHEVAELGIARPDRIRVVPWSVPATSAAPEASPAPVPPGRPVLLCVGTLELRKNVPQLVRAFLRASRDLPHDLVLAGARGPAARQVMATARSSGTADRIHVLGHVTPGALEALYRRAEVTVCPSLYEGFGLTILEAMAYGCPVLAADIPAHREVAGGAVRFVPPGDEGALAAGLVELARDGRARSELRWRGLERSRSFSPDATRLRLQEVLRDAHA